MSAICDERYFPTSVKIIFARRHRRKRTSKATLARTTSIHDYPKPASRKLILRARAARTPFSDFGRSYFCTISSNETQLEEACARATRSRGDPSRAHAHLQCDRGWASDKSQIPIVLTGFLRFLSIKTARMLDRGARSPRSPERTIIENVYNLSSYCSSWWE